MKPNETKTNGIRSSLAAGRLARPIDATPTGDRLRLAGQSHWALSFKAMLLSHHCPLALKVDRSGTTKGQGTHLLQFWCARTSLLAPPRLIHDPRSLKIRRAAREHTRYGPCHQPTSQGCEPRRQG